ncbi:iron-containing alcohol dehydrogenase [Polaromonas eurypsychrophila]|uniref:NAD-dependent 4-hydroxybutyrate dehydrogenase n=1 Tax=Polaromonas eurypsychrophila TaxID=1614635 RepID=A0A916SBW4_9BURK|nr:iron-containing alcohol dehydrogenase [Polaromonas eurypsychrophila]GGA90444.1 NAD-dependent 4-hydroxybutyrate dehydrogenase [Polaromonas eurypsychrophila]
MTTLLFGTAVQFGNGMRRALPAELAKAGIQRPLFVTDKGVRAAGVFAKAVETVDRADHLPVFDDVPPNPTEAAAASGAAMYRQHGCDGVVGIGGGAALDLAKAITILTTHAPPLWNYCNRHASPGQIINAPPLILMPTTSGTGSEVGRSAVIIFDNGIKAGVRCPDIITAAICDPELTTGLPAHITATTGMDALSHCIETFCSPTVNPPADAIALDGMQRVFANLERAVTDGSNLDARWNMMMGSLEGALCFQKGMGAVHALSHPLGALGHHHGTLNAILLPHVLAHNQPALGEKMDRIGRQAGLGRGENVAEALAALVVRLGIPSRLSEIGLTHADLAGIPAAALEDNAHKTNPRPLQHADYEKLLMSAY